MASFDKVEWIMSVAERLWCVNRLFLYCGPQTTYPSLFNCKPG